MTSKIILASTSPARRAMLDAAGVSFEAHPSRVDEDGLKAALLAEAKTPRDIADALAAAKAAKLSARHPNAFVLGSDQTLDLDGNLISKARSREDARAILSRLSGCSHSLYAAAVICEAGRPVWRHVATVELAMRPLTDSFIEAYIDRNWPAIEGSVGGYLIEGEGVRLFSGIRGSHFAILGLPLLEVLSYLSLRGVIAP